MQFIVQLLPNIQLKLIFFLKFFINRQLNQNFMGGNTEKFAVKTADNGLNLTLLCDFSTIITSKVLKLQ